MQKMTRTLKVSTSAVAKTINAMMELALLRTTTGNEDPELPLLQRLSSLELPVSENATQIMLHRVQATDTPQHQLFRGDCVNQA